jgi:hypothetical protein
LRVSQTPAQNAIGASGALEISCAASRNNTGRAAGAPAYHGRLQDRRERARGNNGTVQQTTAASRSELPTHRQQTVLTLVEGVELALAGAELAGASRDELALASRHHRNGSGANPLRTAIGRNRLPRHALQLHIANAISDLGRRAGCATSSAEHEAALALLALLLLALLLLALALPLLLAFALALLRRRRGCLSLSLSPLALLTLPTFCGGLGRSLFCRRLLA